ncbi:MAG: phosphopantetheine-binding protein [Eubacteriales bacterium]|nr:phosphopantetheine-binding protein [Eubacteriales bacterium]
MDLLLVLEEEFDMQIPDEELGKIQTIGDIVNYIERS